MDPITSFFLQKPFIRIIITTIGCEHSDLGTGGRDGLRGFIKVLPDRGRVGAKYLCDDEEVFHDECVTPSYNFYEKLISAC